MNQGASVVEVNFDCLAGPTHHFGGLSFGNLASFKNKALPSSPKKAALQGLKKMHFLMKHGFVQAVLPPHERPHMKSFKNLGFTGDDATILKKAYQDMPEVFKSLCSSSSMWAANAATVSPRSDSIDKKTHISLANLITMFHRSIESDFNYTVFKQIFADEQLFHIHQPLLAHDFLADEGAANHNRLSPSHDQQALQIFVYGKEPMQSDKKTSIFPARQSKTANIALMGRHKLDPVYSFNIEQNPVAIDSGAFHNDVVCVTNENVMLCHELAFCEQPKVIAAIKDRYQSLFDQAPIIIEIANDHLPLKDAVSSYLFNSQILTKTDKTMLLFSPTDCQTNTYARSVIDNILSKDTPINEVAYFHISESMANGGGPACLRLRVPLSPEERASIKPTVFLTEKLYGALESIIEMRYPDDFQISYLFDPNFLDNSKTALAEIATVLGLGTIYDFQR